MPHSAAGYPAPPDISYILYLWQGSPAHQLSSRSRFFCWYSSPGCLKKPPNQHNQTNDNEDPEGHHEDHSKPSHAPTSHHSRAQGAVFITPPLGQGHVSWKKGQKGKNKAGNSGNDVFYRFHLTPVMMYFIDFISASLFTDMTQQEIYHFVV